MVWSNAQHYVFNVSAYTRLHAFQATAKTIAIPARDVLHFYNYLQAHRHNYISTIYGEKQHITLC